MALGETKAATPEKGEQQRRSTMALIAKAHAQVERNCEAVSQAAIARRSLPSWFALRTSLARGSEESLNATQTAPLGHEPSRTATLLMSTPDLEQ